MTRVAEQREQIANRLGEPERLQFPSEWTLSSSWHRAQAAPSTVRAVNPAEFDVLLGYVDDDGLAKHRVLFAIYNGDLIAECSCEGYRFNDWCAHVALLWWKWSRSEISVTDLDTGSSYTAPPWWLSIDDADAGGPDVEPSRALAADGGER